MPRYYFHLTDGKQVLNNHKGMTSGMRCSRRCTALAATSTRRGHAGGRGRTIVDQHGHKVDKVPIADV